MELRSIYCKRRRASSANTLPEYMVSVAVGSIITVFAVTLVVHSVRTFASLANYADMNTTGTAAIDRMTREIRACTGLSFFDPQRIILDPGTNKAPITYAYSFADKTLTRQEGTQPATVLLTGCDSLDFFIYEPIVSSNTLAMPYTTVAADAKAVGVNWRCTRSILGRKVNDDSPKTAVIVMRRP